MWVQKPGIRASSAPLYAKMPTSKTHKHMLVRYSIDQSVGEREVMEEKTWKREQFLRQE